MTGWVAQILKGDYAAVAEDGAWYVGDIELTV